MAAAAPRVPAPSNFLNLSWLLAGPASLPQSPGRTRIRLLRLRGPSKTSALRLVLETSPRCVKVLGCYGRSGMRPCACEPNPAIAFLLWRQATAPRTEGAETNPRSLAMDDPRCPPWRGCFRMSDRGSRFGRACKVCRRGTSHSRGSRQSGRSACAREHFRRSHSPDRQQAGRLPYPQYAFEHGHGPAARYRRHGCGEVD
jgi:hypothetical protein